MLELMFRHTVRRTLLPIILTALEISGSVGSSGCVKTAPPAPIAPIAPSRQRRLDQAGPELTKAQKELARASALIAEGKYAEAQALLEPLLPVLEWLVGAQGSYFSEVLNHLGVVYMRQGKDGLAEAYFLRALQICRKNQGEQSSSVGAILNNLGLLYKDLGDKPRALSFMEQGLRAREAALGPRHLDVAASLIDLAAVHTLWQSWDRAVPLLTRGLQIQEAAVGSEDSLVANTLISLAHLRFLQGNYEQAEPLQARALRIFEKRLGAKSPQLAKALGGAAALAAEAGDYERAEPLLQGAVTALEGAQGRDKLALADMLGRLALLKLHRVTRGLPEALQQIEALLQRANRLAEPFGPRESAIYRRRLFEVSLLQGDRKRTDAAFRQIWQPTRGSGLIPPRLSDPAEVHVEAEVQLSFGNPLSAVSYEEHALGLRKRQKDGNHLDVAQSYQYLATLRALLGQNDEAARLLLEALKLTELRLRTQGSVLSERRLASLLALLREQEEQIYSLLLRAPGHKALRHLALTTLLLRKGRSIDEVSLTSLLQSQIQDRADQQRLEELRDLRSRMASLALQGPDRIPLAQREQLFQRLSAKAEGIEQDLATRVAPLREHRRVLAPEQIVAQVAAALPPAAVLVEIVAFTERPPDQKLSAPDGPLHYLAFLLTQEGAPEVVDLGPRAPIDATAARLQAALSDPKAEYLTEAQDAHRRLFSPLLPALGGRRQVVISPDGVLDLIPFAALHDGQRFLLSDYDISYVTSGRDLVRRNADKSDPPRVVVVADPAFGSTLSASSAGTRGTSQRDRGLHLGSLQPLPGTRQEALAIKQLWPQAQLLLGEDASESALLSLLAPSVLHIATHGLFMADTPSPAAAPVLSLGRGFEAVADALPPNPLLRSALVLAGAQDRFGRTAAQGGTGATATSDGLATALEVSGMNLWGTELVVLSACDSGRGDVLPGQGVYGLRRALQAAGAETLVTSLWRLNDRLTVDLMRRYYQGLRAGEGRGAALRAAALAVQAEHPHPYYWASFIAIGQTAPLRSAR